MEQDIITRIDILEKKIDLMQETVYSLRRYFKISVYLTIGFFVLPLIIAALALPFMIRMISSSVGVGLEGL
jgi:hypothetical protein